MWEIITDTAQFFVTYASVEGHIRMPQVGILKSNLGVCCRSLDADTYTPALDIPKSWLPPLTAIYQPRQGLGSTHKGPPLQG